MEEDQKRRRNRSRAAAPRFQSRGRGVDSIVARARAGLGFPASNSTEKLLKTLPPRTRSPAILIRISRAAPVQPGVVCRAGRERRAATYCCALASFSAEFPRQPCALGKIRRVRGVAPLVPHLKMRKGLAGIVAATCVYR